MTTSTTNNEIEEPIEVEEPEIVVRDIDQLIDLPYSEMTDEEIDRVIQYKADIQTRDNLHNATMQAISDTLAQAAQANMEIALQAQAQLNELTANAINRFNMESNTNEQTQ